VTSITPKGGVFECFGVIDASPDTTTAGQILKPLLSVCLKVAKRSGLAADLPTALIIGRPPFADMFNMPMTAGAHALFVKAADADARRWHRWADVAV